MKLSVEKEDESVDLDRDRRGDEVVHRFSHRRQERRFGKSIDRDDKNEDTWCPGLITTDGLEAYVEKIKRYFKGSMYAQVVKEWEGGRIARVYKIFQVSYNFIRPHMGLTVGKGRGKEKRTPAIAAGLTDHIWNWEGVLLYYPDYPR